MKRYLPPQHGAWAFLALPLVLGASVTDGTWWLLPLAVAWIAAYPLSYAALGLVRSPHPQRFRRPFVVWLAVVVPAALVLTLARPWLVWVGAVYAGLFLVNIGYARRHDERALLNDLVFVVECSAMVLVTAAVGRSHDGGWRPGPLLHLSTGPWVLAAVCALVLTGSTLHVKSLIRERRDPRYAKASRAFAVASIPVALMLGWLGPGASPWLAVAFVALAARAFVGPGPGARPGRIGLVELAGFVLVTVCGAVWA